MKDSTADDGCQRYLEDPEANAAHLQTCATCRAEAAGLAEKAGVEIAAIDLDSLPLAPWEGSSHRSWGFVLGGAVIVIAIALALCDVSGMSPLHVAESSLASMETFRTVLNGASSWLRAAPVAEQIGFGAAFLVINALLIVLLRRAPRGIDA
jgi:hypothetical protein